MKEAFGHRVCNERVTMINRKKRAPNKAPSVLIKYWEQKIVGIGVKKMKKKRIKKMNRNKNKRKNKIYNVVINGKFLKCITVLGNINENGFIHNY